MNTTAPSTGDLDKVLARIVPSPWKQQLDSILAELEHKRAQGADKAAAMRRKHSRHLRACILVVARQHRPQLRQWKGSDTSKTKWLRRQMAAAIELAESRGEKPMLLKPPSIRRIGEVIKTLSFFVRT